MRYEDLRDLPILVNAGFDPFVGLLYDVWIDFDFEPHENKYTFKNENYSNICSFLKTIHTMGIDLRYCRIFLQMTNDYIEFELDVLFKYYIPEDFI